MKENDGERKEKEKRRGYSGVQCFSYFRTTTFYSDSIRARDQ